MSIDPKNLAGTATLTFSDDFNSLSLWNGASGTWDSTYWWAAANGINIGGNQEVNWYINSNYAPTSSVTPWTVSNGILDLHAGPAAAAIQPYINNAQYTSGMITSYHSFSQLYGYFEMRAELPAGQGLWPAFWLLPANNALLGTVPAQELDIMESLGNNPTIDYMTSHSSATGSMQLQQSGVSVPTMTSGFHTYGMDWEADTITWYVDGVKIFQIATPSDMHTPMYMIADLALYGPAITDPSAPVGGDMLIDYIRAYSAKPPVIQINSFSPDSNITGDGITNAKQITLTGSAAVGTTVQIFDGSTKLGTAVTDSTGKWSFVTANLTDGVHPFTAKTADQSGNVTSSTSLTVTVDTTAPAAPSIASFTPDSGTIGDGITNQNHVTLNGTAEASSTVQIFDGTTQIGTVVADKTGSWSFATATLSDGNHAFTAKAMDVAGNVSSASTSLTVTIDTTAPAQPVVASFALAQSAISGTAEAGATIALYDGTILIGSGKAKSDGTWSINVGSLSSGPHSFSVTATDAAGNTSVQSNVLQTKVTESAGSTTLEQVGTSLHFVTGSTDVVFKLASAALSTDQFPSYNFIGAEKTATGYDVAWKDAGTGLYSVVATDTNGNFLSTIAGSVSGTSDALRSLESTMHQDLNGDGTIGLPVKIIETAGSTILEQVGNSLHFVTGSTDVVFKLAGAAVSTDQFPSYNFIGAEKTATGYDVAWKDTGTGLYTVAATDANGNFLSTIVGSVSGSNASLLSLEATMHQDLNGDGTIGTKAGTVATSVSLQLTIDAGGSLELAGAASGAITFGKNTGMLILDQSTKFTGNIVGLSGNGDPTASDILDLRDIAYGAGTRVSYIGNTSGGELTVTDAQNHAAHLNLTGDYTRMTFALSSDGHGGTFVIDPPATNVAPLTLSMPNQAATVSQVGDGFVFHPSAAAASTSTYDGHAPPPFNEAQLDWYTNAIAQDVHLDIHALADAMGYTHTHDSFMLHV
ncbi:MULTISPECIES: Ig-like domain-containing protein [unclassified Bradyrhizobium]|uniref:Ig-like domain-containing protein n=1 Tax=unclassified Bradyrhizobium TaxID=2631580 RepID=UPI001BA70A17|nr:MULTISPECIES: Ig-like domain-containing protein [unclassified Bradyrhizobium]MBR1207472.1 family 16 glycosylhydrolase [Bradyrhizobium sp. AUGA SZCCT0124]MBR1315888.1 family 16 glycosylhydrolase [Bradyrhizobium sp. AUGA SZCCT0051]MBR1343994.1 family 16 glycosylhydrolase [Bradyrhizobium sp. AUGA SZCCT0105]MBR1358019.1 family 16 glycosylhydrolase [Bradyrhizobium sp. AUGA SZCCT0045]